jgi:pimeloyl-ACP methyl ester carboxylesterase
LINAAVLPRCYHNFSEQPAQELACAATVSPARRSLMGHTRAPRTQAAAIGREDKIMTHAPTFVLVHGAFADASGFAGVIRELQSSGYSVQAPANPLRGLHSDASAIARQVAVIDGPVVLVGHSYGGAVITQASAALDNVTGLVYLAAFGIDENESAGAVGEPFPAAAGAANVVPTTYDAPGAVGGPDLFIKPEAFRDTFCADLPVDVAAAMSASQRPVSAAAFTEKATAAGWKTKPSWYLISAHDRCIAPEAEEFMAKRMGATTDAIPASHCAFIAQPVAVARFIQEALP